MQPSRDELEATDYKLGGLLVGSEVRQEGLWLELADARWAATRLRLGEAPCSLRRCLRKGLEPQKQRSSLEAHTQHKQEVTGTAAETVEAARAT